MPQFPFSLLGIHLTCLGKFSLFCLFLISLVFSLKELWLTLFLSSLISLALLAYQSVFLLKMAFLSFNDLQNTKTLKLTQNIRK